MIIESVFHSTKKPSHAELSGEHPFLDIDLMSEFSSISFIHSDQR